MSQQIELMTKDTLGQVAELEALCFSAPWSLQLFTEELDREGTEYRVARGENRQVIGYAGFYTVLEEGYITNVAVHPAARRRGVADRLIAALVQAAREKNLAFLTLEVRAGNTPAIGLYAKHGFIPVGRRKNYYESPREDAVLMTLYLTKQGNNTKEEWRKP